MREKEVKELLIPFDTEELAKKDSIDRLRELRARRFESHRRAKVRKKSKLSAHP